MNESEIESISNQLVRKTKRTSFQERPKLVVVVPRNRLYLFFTLQSLAQAHTHTHTELDLLIPIIPNTLLRIESMESKIGCSTNVFVCFINAYQLTLFSAMFSTSFGRRAMCFWCGNGGGSINNVSSTSNRQTSTTSLKFAQLSPIK